jgi:hypothetical protein
MIFVTAVVILALAAYRAIIGYLWPGIFQRQGS